MIKHWQVGNETPGFELHPTGLEDYVAWFSLVSEAARQADPEARLALVASVGGSSVDAFHQRVVPRLAQAGERFDVIDLHHWGDADDHEMRAVPAVQALLAEQGFGDAEIWSCEHGTHVGRVANAAGVCQPACRLGQVCARLGPNASRCVQACGRDEDCPAAQPSCDVATGVCGRPEQSERDQARSLIRRFVVNRALGVRRILWNNLVAWHCFHESCGSFFDRIGLISGGVLEFEDESDLGRRRLAWYSYALLAERTDEPVAEQLGRLEQDDPDLQVYGYRDRSTASPRWLAWHASQGRFVLETAGVEQPRLRVLSLITDEQGLPLRDEVVEGELGRVEVAVDQDPPWIEPAP